MNTLIIKATYVNGLEYVGYEEQPLLPFADFYESLDTLSKDEVIYTEVVENEADHWKLTTEYGIS